MSRNWEHEERDIRTLLAALKLGHIHPSKVEDDPPDGSVTIDGQVVGVEVRRIFQREPNDGRAGPLPQWIERSQDTVARDCRDLWGDRHPGMAFHLLFPLGVIVRKDQRGPLVLDLVERCDWALGDPDWDGEAIEVPFGTKTVVVDAHPSVLSGDWRVMHDGFVSELTPERLRAAIADKASGVAERKAQFDQIWLLLSLPSESAAGASDLDHRAISQISPAPFDRGFVLDRASKRVFEFTGSAAS